MVEKLQGSSADDRNGSTGAKSTPESFRSHVAAGVLNQTATARQSAHSYAGSPQVHHATASHVLKGEDVLFVEPLGFPQSMLYMVCDGHSSVEAANFVATNFTRILNAKLPARAPSFGQRGEMESFAREVRRALCDTFVSVDNMWANIGHLSGTTVTVVLSIGRLLTAANTGDSSAVLDTGCSILELTRSHRIHTNIEEQLRLREAGQHLASLGFNLQGPAKLGELGVGPLRLWPGGLCVSRAIGDLDAGPEVMPVPHIRQLLLPSEGCRVVMASDGLWDAVSYSKVAKLTRSKTTAAAASSLARTVSRDLRTMDDVSIIVIDFLPTDCTSFPTVALKAGPQGGGKSRGASMGKGKGGGFLACFRPEVEEPDSRDCEGAGHLSLLCDVDCLEENPGVKQLLTRCSIAKQHAALLLRKSPMDFSLHGGTMYPASANVHGLQKCVSVHGMASLGTGAHYTDSTNHSAASEMVHGRESCMGLYAFEETVEVGGSNMCGVVAAPPVQPEQAL